jgi:hypothetical protein
MLMLYLIIFALFITILITFTVTVYFVVTKMD